MAKKNVETTIAESGWRISIASDLYKKFSDGVVEVDPSFEYEDVEDLLESYRYATSDYNPDWEKEQVGIVKFLAWLKAYWGITEQDVEIGRELMAEYADQNVGEPIPQNADIR
jgi:hypothetical protein